MRLDDKLPRRLGALGCCAMPERLITAERARELAAKWRTKPGSALDTFARRGRIASPILQECRDIYAAPISQPERDEVMDLGVYLPPLPLRIAPARKPGSAASRNFRRPAPGLDTFKGPP